MYVTLHYITRKYWYSYSIITKYCNNALVAQGFESSSANDPGFYLIISRVFSVSFTTST